MRCFLLKVCASARKVGELSEFGQHTNKMTFTDRAFQLDSAIGSDPCDGKTMLTFLSKIRHVRQKSSLTAS